MATIVFNDKDPGPEIRRKLNLMWDDFEAALLNAVGWSPIIALVEDNERRVMEVVDWVNGQGDKPTQLGYIGPDGLTSDIEEAIDVRGPIGITGDPGPANTLAIGTVTEGPAAATITGSSPNQTLNLTLPKGNKGDDGVDGWAPILALVADDERFVLQVTDWTGGTGTKPATGDYIGADGLVEDIEDAVDIRGPAGSGTGNVNTSGTVADWHLAVFADGTGTLIKSAGATSSFFRGLINLADAAAFRTAIGASDFSGSWNDLTNKPAVIAAGADKAAARASIDAGTSDFSGSWNDLDDVPAFVAAGDTAEEARDAIGAGTSDFSGSWGDLENRPLGVYPIFSPEAAVRYSLSGANDIARVIISPGPVAGAASRITSNGAVAAFSYNGSVASVYTTADGENIVARTMPSSSNWAVRVNDEGDKWMALAASSTGVAVSSNGTSWASATTFPVTLPTISSAPLFAGVGSRWLVRSTTGTNTDAHLSTDNGATWTAVTLPVTVITRVHSIAGLFVINTSNGATYRTSATGETGSWTNRQLPNSATINNFWQPHCGVLYAATATQVYVTTDGINWTEVPGGATSDALVSGVVELEGVTLTLGGGSALSIKTWHGDRWQARQPSGMANRDVRNCVQVGDTLLFPHSTSSSTDVFTISASDPANFGLFKE